MNFSADSLDISIDLDFIQHYTVCIRMLTEYALRVPASVPKAIEI